MKRNVWILCVIFMLSGCSNNNTQTRESIPLVESEVVRIESYAIQLNYVGVVNSDNIKNYGFKSDGKLENVFVKEGDQVKKGMLLASLDDSDLNLALDVVKGQVEMAESQYNITLEGAREEDLSSILSAYNLTESTYEFNNDNHKKMKALYDVGAISKHDYDYSELNLNIAKEQMNQANQEYIKAKNGAREEDKQAAGAQLKSVRAEYDLRLRLLNDAEIFATNEGTVVSVTTESGDIIPAGFPVIVIQSKEKIVSVGMTQEDVEKVDIGAEAEIYLNNVLYEGEVIKIEHTPDRYTRSYEVELKIIDMSEQVLVGSLVKVLISTDVMDGIWIPINNLFNDGEDYVYIIEDERVAKKNVEVLGLIADKVVVKGLSEGEKIITKGFKKIKLGHKVDDTKVGDK